MSQRAGPSSFDTLYKTEFDKVKTVDPGHNVPVNDEGYLGTLGSGLISQYKQPNPAYVEVPYDDNRVKSYYNAVKQYKAQPGNFMESYERVTATLNNRLNEFELEQQRLAYTTTQSDEQKQINFPKPAEEAPLYTPPNPATTHIASSSTEYFANENVQKNINRFSARNTTLGVNANWAARVSPDKNSLNPYIVTKEQLTTPQFITAVSDVTKPKMLKNLSYGDSQGDKEKKEMYKEFNNPINDVIIAKTEHPNAVPVTIDEVNHDNYDPVTGTFKKFRTIFTNRALSLQQKGIVSFSFGQFQINAPQAVAVILKQLKDSLENVQVNLNNGTDPSRFAQEAVNNIGALKQFGYYIPSNLKAVLNDFQNAALVGDSAAMGFALTIIFRPTQLMNNAPDELGRQNTQNEQNIKAEKPEPMDTYGDDNIAADGSGGGLAGGADDVEDAAAENEEVFEEKLMNITDFCNTQLLQDIAESQTINDLDFKQILVDIRDISDYGSGKTARPIINRLNIKLQEAGRLTLNPSNTRTLSKLHELVKSAENAMRFGARGEKRKFEEDEVPQPTKVTVGRNQSDPATSDANTNEMEVDQPEAATAEPSVVEEVRPPAPDTNPAVLGEAEAPVHSQLEHQTNDVAAPSYDTPEAPPVNIDRRIQTSLLKPPDMTDADFDAAISAMYTKLANGQDVQSEMINNIVAILQHTFNMTTDQNLRANINDALTQLANNRHIVVPAIGETEQVDPEAADSIGENPPPAIVDQRLANTTDEQGNLVNIAAPADQSTQPDLSNASNGVLEAAPAVFALGGPESDNELVQAASAQLERYNEETRRLQTINLPDEDTEMLPPNQIATVGETTINNIFNNTQNLMLNTSELSGPLQEIAERQNMFAQYTHSAHVELYNTLQANTQVVNHIASRINNYEMQVAETNRTVVTLNEIITRMNNGNISLQDVIQQATNAIERLAGEQALTAIENAQTTRALAEATNVEQLRNLLGTIVADLEFSGLRQREQNEIVSQQIANMRQAGTHVSARQQDDFMDNLRTALLGANTALSTEIANSNDQLMRYFANTLSNTREALVDMLPDIGRESGERAEAAMKSAVGEQTTKLDKKLTSRLDELTNVIINSNSRMGELRDELHNRLTSAVGDLNNLFNTHVHELTNGTKTIKEEHENVSVDNKESLQQMMDKFTDLIANNEIPKKDPRDTHIFRPQVMEHLAQADAVLNNIVRKATAITPPPAMLWHNRRNRRRTRAEKAALYHRLQVARAINRPTDAQQKTIFKERNSKVNTNKVTASKTLLLGKNPITHIKKNKNYHQLSTQSSLALTLGQINLNKYQMWLDGSLPFLYTGYTTEPIKLRKTTSPGLPEMISNSKIIQLLV